jgi:hypothetical protein
MLDLINRMSPRDRLHLLEFDAELRRQPRPLIAALWAGVDAVERLESAAASGSSDPKP